jgi:RNA polymerase sigma-70 factor, ECF subfamily
MDADAVVGTAKNSTDPARILRPVESDGELLERLRAGDEAAFVILVGRYQTSLLRVARAYVPSNAVAEEAVQETWMGVVRGLAGFEGRSSFKTWLFRILVNRARTLGSSELRTIPIDDPEPAVDPVRFDASGAWTLPPEPWESVVDERLLAESWLPCIRSALDELPPRQREVVVLRDVEGMASDDVCDVLGISEGNQRVLLHRGRSKLRSQLEGELSRRGR